MTHGHLNRSAVLDTRSGSLWKDLSHPNLQRLVNLNDKPYICIHFLRKFLNFMYDLLNKVLPYNRIAVFLFFFRYGPL